MSRSARDLSPIVHVALDMDGTISRGRRLFCGRFGLARDRVVLVGARVDTDVMMARRAGVGSVLVFHGEATVEDAPALPTPPDLIVADVDEMGERLESARGAVWWGDYR